MIVFDKNETLQQPAGFRLASVRAEGAYLRLAYWQDVPAPVGAEEATYVASEFVIYLNDQGREVLHTIVTHAAPKPAPLLVKLPKTIVSPWFRFKNGFYLAIFGIGEMFTCLNKL